MSLCCVMIQHSEKSCSLLVLGAITQWQSTDSTLKFDVAIQILIQVHGLGFTVLDCILIPSNSWDCWLHMIVMLFCHRSFIQIHPMNYRIIWNMFYHHHIQQIVTKIWNFNIEINTSSAAIKSYQNQHFSGKCVDCQSNSFFAFFSLKMFTSWRLIRLGINVLTNFVSVFL